MRAVSLGNLTLARQTGGARYPRKATEIAKKNREEIRKGSRGQPSVTFLAVPALKEHPHQKAQLKADDERKNQSRCGGAEITGMSLSSPSVR